MFATLVVVLFSTFHASVVAQSSPSVICIAGQCLQGYSNTTLGAKLSASGASASVQLLPGQYTTTTNPQLLHSLLTSSSATLNSSPGFNAESEVSLPLNLALQPGLAIYAQSLYSGQSGFSGLPSEPMVNVSTPLPASSIALSNNIWVAVTSGANKERTVLWDAIPDISQLPGSTSAGGLSLVDVQSSACSPPCSGSGVCSASGTCTCPPGFSGSSCESCAEGFFGPTCQACPEGCASCDQGISGTGRCLTPLVTNAPSTCNCLNGQCGSNGQCTCNPGWTTAENGTACAKCASGFFLDSAGDCQVCQLGCDQCDDDTATCLSCKPGFTQNANDKSKCDPLPSVRNNGQPCPDGSFSSGAECSPCSAACRTCNGPTSNDCIVCATGTYLFNGNCVGANTDGVCQGTNGMIADNNKRECDTCGAKCTSCRIPNFSVASTVDQLQCTGCLPEFVLSEGKCVESCPVGTFVSQDNLTCTPCSSSCGTCAGSANFCLTCTGGQLASNGQCVSTCPSNTFASSSSNPGSCTQCHPDCASCSGSSFNQCTSCPPSRPVLSNGRCLPTCAKSQYFDRTTSSCQTCDSSCSSCSGPRSSNCLACSSSTQVLRAGVCVDANCQGSTSVIPGLGVCLSELVQVPTPDGTGTAVPLPTVTGLTDPTDAGGKKPLEWWQILLMALGCAFIFVMFLMCWRRRARKQRKQQTKLFASMKRLDRPRTWKERLVRFGERFFGHRDRMMFGRRRQADVLPTAYTYDRQERPRSMVTNEYGQDMKMTRIASPTGSKEPRLLTKSKPETKINMTANPIAKRETIDDVDELIDAYDYSRHSVVSSRRPPSTLPDLEERRHNYTQNQRRRLEHDSLYEEVTGKQRNTPEPRQPLRRELSGASMFSSARSLRLAGAGTELRKNVTGGTREGVLVDLEDDGRNPPQLQLPLQMVNSGTPVPRPTDAQVYAMSVRPELVGVPSQPQAQAQAPPQLPTFSPIAIAPTGPGFLPIPVTLTPNTTGGQGSYWLTPVAPNAAGGSLQMQVPFQQPQPQTSLFQQHPQPTFDTVVLQPTHTGGSGSRNPFRQGVTN